MSDDQLRAIFSKLDSLQSEVYEARKDLAVYVKHTGHCQRRFEQIEQTLYHPDHGHVVRMERLSERGAGIVQWKAWVVGAITAVVIGITSGTVTGLVLKAW